MRDRLESQMAELSANLAAPEADGMVAELRGIDVAAKWDDEATDDAWRRKVVGALIERIEVKPVGARTRDFDPGRLDPRWLV